MCILLARGTVCLHLSTWCSLHVSPVPRYQVCLKRQVETSKSSRAEVVRAESGLPWRPRMVGCRMLCLWTRNGAGKRRWERSTGRRVAVASSCRAEHQDQLCWHLSMGTPGCPASRQPAGYQGCTTWAPWQSSDIFSWDKRINLCNIHAEEKWTLRYLLFWLPSNESWEISVLMLWPLPAPTLCKFHR